MLPVTVEPARVRPLPFRIDWIVVSVAIIIALTAAFGVFSYCVFRDAFIVRSVVLLGCEGLLVPAFLVANQLRMMARRANPVSRRAERRPVWRPAWSVRILSVVVIGWLTLLWLGMTLARATYSATGDRVAEFAVAAVAILPLVFAAATFSEDAIFPEGSSATALRVNLWTWGLTTYQTLVLLGWTLLGARLHPSEPAAESLIALFAAMFFSNLGGVLASARQMFLEPFREEPGLVTARRLPRVTRILFGSVLDAVVFALMLGSLAGMGFAAHWYSDSGYGPSLGHEVTFGAQALVLLTFLAANRYRRATLRLLQTEPRVRRTPRELWVKTGAIVLASLVAGAVGMKIASTVFAATADHAVEFAAVFVFITAVSGLVLRIDGDAIARISPVAVRFTLATALVSVIQLPVLIAPALTSSPFIGDLSEEGRRLMAESTAWRETALSLYFVIGSFQIAFVGQLLHRIFLEPFAEPAPAMIPSEESGV